MTAGEGVGGAGMSKARSTMKTDMTTMMMEAPAGLERRGSSGVAEATGKGLLVMRRRATMGEARRGRRAWLQRRRRGASARLTEMRTMARMRLWALMMRRVWRSRCCRRGRRDDTRLEQYIRTEFKNGATHLYQVTHEWIIFFGTELMRAGVKKDALARFQWGIKLPSAAINEARNFSCNRCFGGEGGMRVLDTACHCMEPWG